MVQTFRVSSYGTQAKDRLGAHQVGLVDFGREMMRKSTASYLCCVKHDVKLVLGKDLSKECGV